MYNVNLLTVASEIAHKNLLLKGVKFNEADLDLLKAIECYREYPNNYVDIYTAYPSIIRNNETTKHLKDLWSHFDSLTAEQLADLAIACIHEVLIC
jgi:hypothetical protein